MKRIFTWALAACLLVLLGFAMTGCNRGDATPAPTPAAATPAPATPAPPPADGPIDVPELPPEAYDGVTNFRIIPEGETAVITVFYPHGADGTILPEQAIFVAAEEMTGVRINNIANPNIADASESFIEMLLTGDISEIIFGNFTDVMPYIDEGLFLDISDIIFTYAPNIIRYFNLIPATRVASTHHDGGIYFLRAALIGAASENPQPSVMPFIRYDWLDELGLSVPTTFDEFEAVLYAFRDGNVGDPGSQTIPFFSRLGTVRPLLQVFGVRGDWNGYFIDERGVVGHGMVSEEFRDALVVLQRWYADGILDPEIFTRGGMARQELLGNNQGGVTIDWPGSTGALNYNEDMRANVPTMDWRYMRFPTTVQGNLHAYWGRGSTSTFGWGVSAAVSRERAIEIVRFMDFWFSEPGARLASFGIEGYSYTLVNGEPQFMPHALAHPGGIPLFMRTLGSQEFPSWPMDISFEVNNFVGQSIIDGYMDHLYNVRTFDPFPPLALLPHESAAIASVDWSFAEEFLQSAIIGTIDPVAMWDAFIDQAQREGVFEAIAAQQSAYDRFRAAAN